VAIKDMSCGLIDTFAYYTPQELRAGFVKGAAFQPRVIKQNRGSAGEGIWLCWLEDKAYCAQFGARDGRQAEADGDERQPHRAPHRG
jgi:hypothetical protein